MMQLLTATGFGDSGSSAITDILREYDCVDAKSSEWECTFLHEADGLVDLGRAIAEGHRLKVDLAAARFLDLCKMLSALPEYRALFRGAFYARSTAFIDSLFGIRWHGGWHRRDAEKDALPFTVRRRIGCAEGWYNAERSAFTLYENYGWKPCYRHYDEMRYCNDTVHFYECARNYVADLVTAVRPAAGLLCIDQLLPPISIQEYLPYFETAPKVFVVDKDPRDLYITNQLFNASRYVPSADVDTFIKWYRATRSKSRACWHLPNVYAVKLDDLVNDYGGQLCRIERFCGMSHENHTKPLAFFEPEKSRTNTQLYRRYTNYAAEIRKIEKELEEFLYAGSEVPCENPRAYPNPVIEIVRRCDDIQDGIRLRKGRLKAAAYGTLLGIQLCRFSRRKTLRSKCAGMAKLAAGAVLFVPQLLVNMAVV